MRKMNLNSIYTAMVMEHCAKESIKNKQRKKARELYNQAMAEANVPQPTPIASAPIPSDKPWLFPTIEDCMDYHTSWATKDIKADVEAISLAMCMGNQTCIIDGVNQGAMLTQYLLKPTGKTTYAKLLRLTREFQGAFNTNNIRLYQNGVHVVVEVPGSTNTVRVADILRCDDFYNAKGLAVAVGKAIDGSNFIANIEKMPHMLIAGTTGSGKSVFMQGLIVSLLLRLSPDELEMYMVDPKMVEFSYYEPLYMCHVVTEVKDAVDLLSNLCDEMDDRYRQLSDANVRDIDEYNAKMDCPMKRKIVFVDELADLIMTSKKAVESCIVRLAQKARACGIHLVLATQRPTVNVVTGLIKANIQTRVCFAVSSTTDSCVMLDRGGAEQLLGKGDMLYKTGSGVHAVRLQGGFIESKEINNIVAALMQNQ